MHLDHKIAWNTLANEIQKSYKTPFCNNKIKYFHSTISNAIDEFAETELHKVTTNVKTSTHDINITSLKLMICNGKVDEIISLIDNGLDISKYYYCGYSPCFNGGLAHLSYDYTAYYIILNLQSLGLKIQRYNISKLFNDIVRDITEIYDYRENKTDKYLKLTKSPVQFCKYLFKVMYTMRMLDKYNKLKHKSAKLLPDYIASFCNSLEKIPKQKPQAKVQHILVNKF